MVKTFPDNLASSKVPVEMLLAFNPVRPLPSKVPVTLTVLPELPRVRVELD